MVISRLNRNQGFTLIELVIVLVLMAALIVFLAPALSNAINLPERTLNNERVAQVAHVLSQRIERIIDESNLLSVTDKCLYLRDKNACFEPEGFVLRQGDSMMLLAEKVQGKFGLKTADGARSAILVEFDVPDGSGRMTPFARFYLAQGGAK